MAMTASVTDELRARVELAGPEGPAANMMVDEVVAYLAGCQQAGARGTLRVFSVSKLTVRSRSTDVTACARELARSIAETTGAGAFFVADRSPSDRPHVHGMILASDGESAIRDWVQLTYASPRGQSLTEVDHSDGSWENPELRPHFKRILEYATGCDYADAPSLRARMLAATGPFHDMWARTESAMGSLLDWGGARLPVPPPRPRRASSCWWCGKAFEGRRRHAKYCVDSCKTAAWTERKAVAETKLSPWA